MPLVHSIPIGKTIRPAKFVKRDRAGICFCCRSVEATEQTGTLLSCGRKKCEVHFHKNCFASYNVGDFTAELMADTVKGTNTPFCSRHYCASCYGNGYRTRAFYGKHVNCSQCELAWHQSCVPAGSTTDENGEIVCPRHVTFAVNRHITHCHHCQTKDASKGFLLHCQDCVRSIHLQCAIKSTKYSADDLAIAAKEGTFQCSWCSDFAYVTEGQPCMAYSNKTGLSFNYYPCTPVPNDEYPNQKDKKLGRLGYVAIKWFSWQGKCTYSIIPHSHIVEMNDSDFFFGTFKSMIGNVDGSLVEEWCNAQRLLADPKSRLPRDDQKPLRGQLPVEPKIIKHYVRWDQTKEKFVKANVPSTDFFENHDSPCNCPEADERCLRNCANRITAKECPASCHERGHCNNRVIQEGQKCASLEVFDSSHCGKGIRATAEIKPDTYLDEYYGEIIDNAEMRRRQQKECSFKNQESQFYIMHVQGNYCLDAREAGGVARYVNHSCDPNCVIKRIECGMTTRVALFSTRSIACGEELTFNYSMLNVNADSGVLPSCFCGAATCSGVLGGKSKNRRREIEPQEKSEKENENIFRSPHYLPTQKRRLKTVAALQERNAGSRQQKAKFVETVRSGRIRKDVWKVKAFWTEQRTGSEATLERVQKRKAVFDIDHNPLKAPICDNSAAQLEQLCKEMPSTLQTMKVKEFELDPLFL